MKVLLDNSLLKVTVSPKNNKTAVICFTGIGHALGGIDIQGNEFYKISSDATAIFIIDKQRSWGNNIDFISLKNILQPYIEDKVLYSIGNSMGGFLAILASRFFDFTSVVSFVPQYSVSKKIIPTENRWDQYVKKIKNWKYESLEGSFQDNTVYYIISGLGHYDREQVKYFPNQGNIRKVLFLNPIYGHNVAARLKEMGVLYDLISCCFMKRSSTEIIKMIRDRSSQN